MPDPCSPSGEILSAVFASLFLLSEYIGLSKCKSGSIFEIFFSGFCLKWSITKVDAAKANQDENEEPVIKIVESGVGGNSGDSGVSGVREK